MPVLTFILNVLGEVLSIGNLYCSPFHLAGSGLCARKRDFQNQLLNVVLANSGRPFPPLIVEQTPTALLVDGHRDSFETAPRIFFDNGRARLGGLHSTAWYTDRSKVETNDRCDMYTLTYFTPFFCYIF